MFDICIISSTNILTKLHIPADCSPVIVFRSNITGYGKPGKGRTGGFYDSKLRQKPEYINVEEVADLLRASNQTVYNMIREGFLKATKIGCEWRFSRDDMVSLIKSEKDRGFFVAARKYDELTAEDEKIEKKYYEKLKVIEE